MAKEWSLRDRVRKVFAGCKGIDIILIANSGNTDPNFRYLTGFSGDMFEGSTVLVKRAGAIMLAGPLEYGDVQRSKPYGMKVMLIRSRKQMIKFLKKELARKRVGMNYDFIPHSTYMRFKRRYRPSKVIDISEAFTKARQVKDDYEIAQVKRANLITKKAMREIRKKFRTGITEKELAKEFDYLSSRFGSEGPSFNTIVSFGKNTALIHHSPGSARLKYGDLIMIDAGARVNNYCSDVTRTFIFGNKAKIKDYAAKSSMIGTVKDAQAAALAAIRPGVKAYVPHNTAFSHISKADKGKYKKFNFPYALGHQVGLEVHDAGEGFYPKSKLILRENMIITDEPGIYIPGFGGARIEDDILITKKGAVIL